MKKSVLFTSLIVLGLVACQPKKDKDETDNRPPTGSHEASRALKSLIPLNQQVGDNVLDGLAFFYGVTPEGKNCGLRLDIRQSAYQMMAHIDLALNMKEITKAGANCRKEEKAWSMGVDSEISAMYEEERGNAGEQVLTGNGMHLVSYKIADTKIEIESARASHEAQAQGKDVQALGTDLKNWSYFAKFTFVLDKEHQLKEVIGFDKTRDRYMRCILNKPVDI